MQLEKKVSYTLHLSQKDAVSLLHALRHFSQEFTDGPRQSAYLRAGYKFSKELVNTLRMEGVPDVLGDIEHDYGIVAAIDDGEPHYEEIPEPSPAPQLVRKPVRRDERKAPPARRSNLEEDGNLVTRRTRQSVPDDVDKKKQLASQRVPLSAAERAQLDAAIAAELSGLDE